MKYKNVACAAFLMGCAIAGSFVTQAAPPSRQHEARKQPVNAASEYPIIELRQYTMYENTIDKFIELFDREFVESQEILGSRLFGQFRDVDDPNKFVWIRGFRNMPERGTALNTFYYGPVWRAHREAANPALKDNDDVLFLRAPSSAAAFQKSPARIAHGSEAPPAGLVTVNIYYLNEEPEAFLPFFEKAMLGPLKTAGGSPLSYFIPERSPNNFPRLKVREGERVLVWFSRFKDLAEYDSYRSRLEGSKTWAEKIAPRLKTALAKPPQILRLRATPRSSLR